MSNRTAEASKAIRKKWAAENQLVLEGKGTRDWTPQQQKDILEKGKAYDEDGRAFEGHHMKSAEAHPEYQGDPDNIQFLTRAEHKAAHGGDFHNATNGYYDPFKNVTVEFDDELIPCSIIELSDPVYVVIQEAQTDSSNSTDNISGNDPEGTDKIRPAPDDVQDITVYPETAPVVNKKRNFLENALEGIKTFSVRRPRWYKFGKIVVVAVPTVFKITADYSNLKNTNGSNVTVSYDSPRNGSSSPDNINLVDENNSIYPEHRNSPIEHTVKASGQHYNTKNGRIYREKDAYQRGGKKDKMIK